MDRQTELMRNYLVRAMRERADLMRRVADEIDRTADRAMTVHTDEFRGSEIANNLAYFAGTVVHDVMALLPNLNLPALVNGAYDVDRQVAEDRGRAEGKS